MTATPQGAGNCATSHHAPAAARQPIRRGAAKTWAAKGVADGVVADQRA
ncbi:hypothetical protein ACFYR1_11345 [Streptomyces canus]